MFEIKLRIGLEINLPIAINENDKKPEKRLIGTSKYINQNIYLFIDIYLYLKIMTTLSLLQWNRKPNPFF